MTSVALLFKEAEQLFECLHGGADGAVPAQARSIHHSSQAVIHLDTDCLPVREQSWSVCWSLLSCGRVCECKCLFELGDIEVEGRDGVPVQHVRVGREEVFDRRKYLAQLVEQLAQVIASLGLGCVGPEEEGKMLALLGDIAMQDEVGEQVIAGAWC